MVGFWAMVSPLLAIDAAFSVLGRGQALRWLAAPAPEAIHTTTVDDVMC